MLEYKGRGRYGIVVRIPASFRQTIALAHDILLFTNGRDFEGGLLWLQQWNIGVNEIARVGWRTVENLRRAHGNMESLEIAPAQLFRSDEFVDLHVFLAQALAFGWGSYFVPRVGGYFLDIRTSDRLFCRTESAETLTGLYSSLREWRPSADGDSRSPRRRRVHAGKG